MILNFVVVLAVFLFMLEHGGATDSNSKLEKIGSKEYDDQEIISLKRRILELREKEIENLHELKEVERLHDFRKLIKDADKQKTCFVDQCQFLIKTYFLILN